MLGGLVGGDRSLPHLHLREPIETAEDLKITWQRSVLLVTAITRIHPRAITYNVNRPVKQLLKFLFDANQQQEIRLKHLHAHVHVVR